MLANETKTVYVIFYFFLLMVKLLTRSLLKLTLKKLPHTHGSLGTTDAKNIAGLHIFLGMMALMKNILEGKMIKKLARGRQ